MPETAYNSVQRLLVNDVRINMDDLESLATFLDRHSLTHVELEENGVRVVLEREAATEAIQLMPKSGTLATIGNDRQSQTGKPATEPCKDTLVTAPLLGIVYCASEPGSSPYVQIGQRVNEGDTLCLIEAMKMFNEVPSPCSGVITEVHFDDGTLAEYGSPLFSIG
jgi:acetyl-CoA carboxylase biotin carboxyl carrier protein